MIDWAENLPGLRKVVSHHHMNPLLQSWIIESLRRRTIELEIFSNRLSWRFDQQLDDDDNPVRDQLNHIAKLENDGLITKEQARLRVLPILSRAADKYPIAHMLGEMIIRQDDIEDDLRKGLSVW